MKDEEIKLPEFPVNGFGEVRSNGVTTKFFSEHTVISLMREAVRLNQTIDSSTKSQAEAWKEIAATLDKLSPKWWQSGDSRAVDSAIKVIEKAFSFSADKNEPLPFNLESAKRGEIVIHGGKEKRWIGFSSIEDGLNIVESSSGVGYAADCELFMKPKPMRTAYVCVYRSGKLEIFDDANTAGKHGGQYGISIFEVQIPDVR